MAFYLRKAFKTGPVRLNLSKGGIGISAGVTGARIGMNSRGAYVHGGRHGLYYRKQLNSGKKAVRNRQVNASRASQHVSGPVDLFMDTGATLANDVAGMRNSVRTEVALPSDQLITTPVQIGIFASVGLLLLSIGMESMLIFILSLLGAILCIGWIGFNYSWKRKAKRLLNETVEETERTKTLHTGELSDDLALPESWNRWLGIHLHAIITEMAIADEAIDTASTIRSLDEHFSIHKETAEKIRVTILGKLLDDMLDDSMLSEAEEMAFRELADQLGVTESAMGEELRRLEYFSQIRKAIERPLVAIDPGIPLVRGEEAYELFEPVRLLNERVLNRYQRDNVQYREVGYLIDMEGKLVLTDRRLLFIGRGTREYRLNRLVDTTVDTEAGIVELILNNRATPVIITVKNPLVFAERLEKIIEN